MQSKQQVKSKGYNESKEEAKNPGALLGLIMGAYPAVLVIGMLVAMAFFGLRGGKPVEVPKVEPSVETIEVQATDPPDIDVPGSGKQSSLIRVSRDRIRRRLA